MHKPTVVCKAARPCHSRRALTLTTPVTPGTSGALSACFARMAVDCMIVRELFKRFPWLETEITWQARATLGAHPRRSCAVGVAVRLTRERARLEGWPWPTFEQVIDYLARQDIAREEGGAL